MPSRFADRTTHMCVLLACQSSYCFAHILALPHTRAPFVRTCTKRTAAHNTDHLHGIADAALVTRVADYIDEGAAADVIAIAVDEAEEAGGNYDTRKQKAAALSFDQLLQVAREERARGRDALTGRILGSPPSEYSEIGRLIVGSSAAVLVAGGVYKLCVAGNNNIRGGTQGGDIAMGRQRGSGARTLDGTRSPSAPSSGSGGGSRHQRRMRSPKGKKR